MNRGFCWGLHILSFNYTRKVFTSGPLMLSRENSENRSNNILAFAAFVTITLSGTTLWPVGRSLSPDRVWSYKEDKNSFDFYYKLYRFDSNFLIHTHLNIKLSSRSKDQNLNHALISFWVIVGPFSISSLYYHCEKKLVACTERNISKTVSGLNIHSNYTTSQLLYPINRMGAFLQFGEKNGGVFYKESRRNAIDSIVYLTTTAI